MLLSIFIAITCIVGLCIFIYLDTGMPTSSCMRPLVTQDVNNCTTHTRRDSFFLAKHCEFFKTQVCSSVTMKEVIMKEVPVGLERF